LSKAVDAILPADRVVASDSGHFCGWVPRYLRVPNARASCLSHSFQSVGLGLPSVIGLAIANPGKLAVLGTGDGGFLMSMADLEQRYVLGFASASWSTTTVPTPPKSTIFDVKAIQSISCSSRTRILRQLREATARAARRCARWPISISSKHGSPKARRECS